MQQQIKTVATTIPTDDDRGAQRAQQIAERDFDLAKLTDAGYALTSTVALTGTDRVTILDTLAREDPTA